MLAVLFAVVVPTAAAFVLPTTSDAYRSYLLGDWTLRKRLLYTSGGLSGTFEGTASFRPLGRQMLSYVESGTFTSDSGQLETRNRLVYDFSDWAKVDVLHDVAEERSTAEAILAQSRLLYSLSQDERHAGTMVSPRTTTAIGSTGGEEFWGELEIAAEDSFLSTWNVDGPAQKGQIMSLFRRQQLIV